MGRKMANLVPIEKENGLKRKTISYARYLMSIKLRRELEKWEQVDHIDNDCGNDCLSNLQILTVSDNNIKEARRRGKKVVHLICPFCKKNFVRRTGHTHLKGGHNPNGKYTACSRECSGKFASMLIKNPNSQQVIEAIMNNVVLETKQH